MTKKSKCVINGIFQESAIIMFSRPRTHPCNGSVEARVCTAGRQPNLVPRCLLISRWNASMGGFKCLVGEREGGTSEGGYIQVHEFSSEREGHLIKGYPFPLHVLDIAGYCQILRQKTKDILILVFVVVLLVYSAHSGDS